VARTKCATEGAMRVKMLENALADYRA